MMPLDDAYANAAYIAGAETYPPKWEAAAAAFREELGARAELGLHYGTSDRQVFDFFNTTKDAQGTVIFVHGGYWKAFDRSSWSHLAAGALAAGWSVAMPSYDLCPDVQISQITRQIAQAVQAIAARTDGPLALTGHSAGGHLVARMLAPGVLPDDVRARILRVAPISPVADLLPLLQTSMNELFQMDEAAARSESPTRQDPPKGAQVRIWVGAEERPVFLEQAEALARAWDIENTVVPEKHHFDVIDALEDAQSDIVRFLTAT